MASYRVEWTTEIDAESPHEAAARALADLRNPAAGATIFKVTAMVLASEKFPGRDAHRGGPDRLVLTGSAVLVDLNPELS